MLSKNITSYIKYSKGNDILIVKYLDTSCPNCASEIKKLNDISRRIPKSKVQLVCFSEDKFLYFKYLYKENKFPQVNFPFLLDTANLFVIRNKKLSVDLQHSVIITDSTRKVLATIPILNVDQIVEQVNSIRNEN